MVLHEIEYVKYDGHRFFLRWTQEDGNALTALRIQLILWTRDSDIDFGESDAAYLGSLIEQIRDGE